MQQPVAMSPGRRLQAVGEGAHAPPPYPPCLLHPPQGTQGVQGRGSHLLQSGSSLNKIFLLNKSSKVLKLHKKGQAGWGQGHTASAIWQEGSVEIKHGPGLLPPPTSSSSN